jgi:hypothetical protein
MVAIQQLLVLQAQTHPLLSSVVQEDVQVILMVTEELEVKEPHKDE